MTARAVRHSGQVAQGWRRTLRLVAADSVALPLLAVGFLSAAAAGLPFIVAAAVCWRTVGRS